MEAALLMPQQMLELESRDMVSEENIRELHLKELLTGLEHQTQSPDAPMQSAHVLATVQSI